MKNKKIVCIGGGIGTSNLIKGIKEFSDNITAIISVADNGGSAGRLRRLYKMHPPGDIISCLAALADNEKLSELLTYRMPGDRYGKDEVLPGHKVGNIMLAATNQITGNFDEGINYLKQIFSIKGNVYPATDDIVDLVAITVEGQTIEGEETIDLGEYKGQRVLSEVKIKPDNPKVNPQVIQSILEADVIIAGPGDLYTAVLPVLIVPQIKDALIKSKAQKIFVINIANKPFETKGYKLENFIQAIEKHLGNFPFTKVVCNNNYSYEIPHNLHYTFVKFENCSRDGVDFITGDVVDMSFPIYHDKHKLAKLIAENI